MQSCYPMKITSMQLQHEQVFEQSQPTPEPRPMIMHK